MRVPLAIRAEKSAPRQLVRAAARLVVDDGRAELQLVTDGLRDATADRGALAAGATRLVVHLDGHRVTGELAVADQTAVIPHRGDRTRELHTALELLHDHVHAVALRHASDLQPGDAVADDERDLRAALEHLVVAQVVQRAARGLQDVVHVDVRRLGPEHGQRGPRRDGVVAGRAADAHLRAVAACGGSRPARPDPSRSGSCRARPSRHHPADPRTGDHPRARCS
jgi:hypothetical protein